MSTRLSSRHSQGIDGEDLCELTVISSCHFIAAGKMLKTFCYTTDIFFKYLSLKQRALSKILSACNVFLLMERIYNLILEKKSFVDACFFYHQNAVIHVHTNGPIVVVSAHTNLCH